MSLATNFYFLQFFLKKIAKNSRIFMKNAAFSYILGANSCQIFQKISQLSNFVKTFRKIFSKNVFFLYYTTNFAKSQIFAALTKEKRAELTALFLFLVSKREARHSPHPST